ncbi:Clp protease N-terminal domain-containing protein [Pengzhenrongella sicca]|uniref:Clp R domain-containing protein n=1 Tax=Pengzhenrongella sicca TaxID=2819238 RepID=A0A8A4ZF87_9MICO|nr:Clp protease N-terminal domain-containing protein [Pengzhenrongella sicca]QTE29206.1 hypothetical protein J4E96_18275 [Pengzhenrongella sicca]
MADKPLPNDLAGILRQGRAIAYAMGARTLEAEHLLLALADDADSPAARALGAAGLDPDRIRALLRAERRQSLAHAGVELVEDPVSSLEPGFTPRWGTSAKDALVRGKAAAGGGLHRETAADLLVGVLGAEVGTVPRALALAGIDRAELIDGLVAGLR